MSEQHHGSLRGSAMGTQNAWGRAAIPGSVTAVHAASGSPATGTKEGNRVEPVNRADAAPRGTSSSTVDCGCSSTSVGGRGAGEGTGAATGGCSTHTGAELPPASAPVGVPHEAQPSAGVRAPGVVNCQPAAGPGGGGVARTCHACEAHVQAQVHVSGSQGTQQEQQCQATQGGNAAGGETGSQVAAGGSGHALAGGDTRSGASEEEEQKWPALAPAAGAPPPAPRAWASLIGGGAPAAAGQQKPSWAALAAQATLRAPAPQAAETQRTRRSTAPQLTETTPAQQAEAGSTGGDGGGQPAAAAPSASPTKLSPLP